MIVHLPVEQSGLVEAPGVRENLPPIHESRPINLLCAAIRKNAPSSDQPSQDLDGDGSCRSEGTAHEGIVARGKDTEHDFAEEREHGGAVAEDAGTREPGNTDAMSTLASGRVAQYTAGKPVEEPDVDSRCAAHPTEDA